MHTQVHLAYEAVFGTSQAAKRLSQFDEQVCFATRLPSVPHSSMRDLDLSCIGMHLVVRAATWFVGRVWMELLRCMLARHRQSDSV